MFYVTLVHTTILLLSFGGRVWKDASNRADKQRKMDDRQAERNMLSIMVYKEDLLALYNLPDVAELKF